MSQSYSQKSSSALMTSVGRQRGPGFIGSGGGEPLAWDEPKEPGFKGGISLQPARHRDGPFRKGRLRPPAHGSQEIPQTGEGGERKACSHCPRTKPSTARRFEQCQRAGVTEVPAPLLHCARAGCLQRHLCRNTGAPQGLLPPGLHRQQTTLLSQPSEGGGGINPVKTEFGL